MIDGGSMQHCGDIFAYLRTKADDRCSLVILIVSEHLLNSASALSALN